MSTLDSTKRNTLRSIIDSILSDFPELKSKIAWNVPNLHLNGQYVVGICAYKHHLTFSPWSPRVIEAFKQRLEKFVVFKTCFQMPLDWEIDKQLLRDLVRARLDELE